MKTSIFFYTGTGNSLWTSRLLANELGDTEIIPMTHVEVPLDIKSEAVGLVFPVHIWGLPHRVIEFLHMLPEDDNKYYFALAVNAGQVAATLLQLRKLMTRKGLKLSSGFDIMLPGNYIPWGGPGPEEKRQERFSMVKEKIKAIAPVIANQKEKAPEKGPLWQNILFSGLYKLSFNQVPKMDKDFWVDERCDGCGICQKVCPARNIILESGMPVWNHRCEQCLACIQWCPKTAIQYGKKTPKYERYHHPDVQLKDIIACAKTPPHYNSD